MIISPEFRRNLWLEISQQRLINMPLVLFGIFLVSYLFFDAYEEIIANSVVYIYVILIIFWGSHNAARSVVSEIEDATWDAQRLSPISPWPMCWGKLFGSTIYNWYGGFICLAVYLFFSPSSFFANLQFCVFMILLGVMAHGLCLFASLVTLQKSRQYGRSASQGITLLGVLSPIPFAGFWNNDVMWYGQFYSGLDFASISAAVFCIWSLLASQRIMRQELQYRSTPIVWFGFVIFLPFYGAGFIPGQITEYLYLSYIIILILAYLALLADKKDPRSWKRLGHGITQKAWTQSLINLPPWLVNLLLLPCLAIPLLFTEYQLEFLNLETHLKYFLCNTYLFLLRDIGVIVFFCLSLERKRAEAAALFYLILLYLLIPLIFHLMGFSFVSALLQPIGSQYPLITFTSGLFQVMILAIVIYKRWQSNYESLKLV